MVKLKGFLVILMVLFLFGCSNENNDNFHFVTLSITNAELPESFELSNTYNIRIDYVSPDGCTLFDGLNVSSEGELVRNIEAVGTTYTDVVCTQALVEGSTSFEFEAVKLGTYIFRFYNATGTESDGVSYLEYSIPVTD